MAEPVHATALVLSSEEDSGQDSREAIWVGSNDSAPTAGASEAGVTSSAPTEPATATLAGSEPTVARKSSVIEVPPLRLPSLDNIFVKTWLRMSAFFTHVLPMLVGMNVLVRLTVESGWAAFPDAWSRVTSRLLGVRAEVLAGVIATAVQRYLAPVVLLNLELSSREATIASAMVSVSFPCAPVTALALGEIGARRTGFIFLLGAVFPLAVAALLNLVLP